MEWENKTYNDKSEEISEIKDGKGQVKEYYDNGILKFEGKYFNGERNGNGKEYDDNGKLIFEGKYSYGKRWNGKEKEYNSNGKLLFKVEYLKGERNEKECHDDDDDDRF